MVEEDIPLHKLKVITSTNSNENHAEVRKIIDHKDKNNQRYYLVDWKNDSENSWVHENDFNTKDIIKKYLTRIEKTPNEPTKRGRGRPKKVLNMLITIIILFFFTGLVGAKGNNSGNLADYSTSSNRINSSVTLCLKTLEKMPIDIDSICEKDTQLNKAKLEFAKNIRKSGEFYRKWLLSKGLKPMLNHGTAKVYIKLDVYTKESNSVVGTGYECFQERVVWTFQESFLGKKFKSFIKNSVSLNRIDCLIMVDTKLCQKHKMNCRNSECLYRETITESYSLWGPTSVVTTNCRFRELVITAGNKKSQLFGKDCTLDNLLCRMTSSIIIWDKDLQEHCPFRRVMKNVEFEILTDGILSKEHNIYLQFKSMTKYCDHELFESVEGLYFKHELNNDSFYKQSSIDENLSVDIKSITELSLATLDFNSKSEESDVKEIYNTQCSNLIALIKVFALKQDEFMSFNQDSDKGRSITLYSQAGNVYEPDCESFDSFQISRSNDNCYKDLKITVSKNNETINAFLTKSGIARLESEEVPCN